MAKILTPERDIDSVDKYLKCGINALKTVGANPRVFVRVFNRCEGAVVGGVLEFISALVYANRHLHPDELVIWSLEEGTVTQGARSTIMTIEGPAQMILPNETLLHYLNIGTKAFTLAHNYPGSELPWIDMGARDRTDVEQAIYSRAFAKYGISTTVPKWTDTPVGTMSHSQISAAMAYRLEPEVEAVISEEVASIPEAGREKVAATIRATIAFHRGNPEDGVIVLADYAARTAGCAATAIATYKACERLGIKLLGCRLDISKSDLDDEPIVDRELVEEYQKAIAKAEEDLESWQMGEVLIFPADVAKKYQGVSLKAITKTREILNAAGLEDFLIIVSGGMKLDKIAEYLEAGASRVGIGEDAARFLSGGECNHTSDSCGYFDGDKFVPVAKDGRELSRIVSQDVIDNFKPGNSMFPDMVRHVSLHRYLYL